MYDYLAQHIRAARLSYNRFWQTPMASLLTIAVIGIALALPSALYVVFQNAKTLTSNWQRGTHISLFLKMDVQNKADVDSLLTSLKVRPDVKDVIYIPPEKGLQSLAQQGDFSDVIADLPGNPLPGVIDVIPQNNITSPAQAQMLVQQLQSLPQVAVAKLDMQWLQRLQTILWLFKRGVDALVVLLALAVILVIGNTIRLATQNRRREIEVIKLIGGSDAFVRRPFLYSGLYFGLAGGLLAWALVIISMTWLSGPLNRLTLLYQSSFMWHGLNSGEGLLLLVVSAGLGLLGAHLAVRRHISVLNSG